MKRRPNHRGISKGNALALLRRLGAFCAFLVAGSFAHAGSKTSADFLKIPIGAQGAGMGQAYTALAEGVDALNWNPAGIALAPTHTGNSSLGLSLSHQDHVFGTGLDQFGLVMPSNVSRRTAIGVNMIRLTYGEQERRTADRQKNGTFESYDLSLGLAVARSFNGLFAGAQVKMLRQELAGYSAQGYALDLGLQGAGPINRMYYGLSVRNLGPRMKFIEESFHLPLTVTVGTAYRVTGPLSLTVDLVTRPHQSQTSVAMGAQFAASRMIALRAGYLAKLAETVTNSQRSETNRGSFGGMSGMGAGLGLRFPRFSLDYALTPFGELGNTQTVTISSWFGGRQAPRRELDIQVEPEAAAPQPEKPMLDVPLDHEDWWNRMR